MLNRSWHYCCILTLLALTCLRLDAGAAPQSRIKHRINDAVRTRIHGATPRQLKIAKDVGPAAGLTLPRVTLVFKPSPDQERQLDLLLRQQQDPASPYYRKWLSPEEYGNRFGISTTDLQAISSWLLSRGVQVLEVSPGRTAVSISGPAEKISALFQTPIRRYELNGRSHYGNSHDPSVPAALLDMVLAVRNLDDFPLVFSQAQPKQVRANFTSNVSGKHFLAPDDIATIYNIKPLHERGITGKGQKIAVVGQTSILLSDIRQFRFASGLPPNDPRIVLVPGSGDPGLVDRDLVEANLDLQWAGAIAPEAEIIYVNSGRGVIDALQYAVDHNLAPVISMSYGNCEQNFTGTMTAALAAMTRQANAQGQTIVAASGDRGATDCDFDTTTAKGGLAVNLPASLPSVTGIGGTRFNEGGDDYWYPSNNPSGGSARGYIPETVWNDSASTIANGGELASGGGGLSARFSRPSWQIGLGAPESAMRSVPDISLAASAEHTGYLICNHGSCVHGFRSADYGLTVVGGTSAGAPVFAAVMALVNQLTGERQGNANPTLYWLAGQAPNAFHDITHGDNKSPCAPGSRNCPSGTASIGYSAAPGYDLATGLGSLDVHKLATAWETVRLGSDFELRTTQEAVTVPAGGTATASITVASLGSFTSSVQLTCEVSPSLAGTLCAVAPGTVVPDSNATVTLTAPARGIRARNSHHSWALSASLIIGGVLLTVAARRPRTTRSWSRQARLVVLIFGLSAAFATSSCGGGSSSDALTSSQRAAAQTGTVTVHGSSGDTARAIVIEVSVR